MLWNCSAELFAGTCTVQLMRQAVMWEQRVSILLLACTARQERTCWDQLAPSLSELWPTMTFPMERPTYRLLYMNNYNLVHLQAVPKLISLHYSKLYDPPSHPLPGHHSSAKHKAWTCMAKAWSVQLTSSSKLSKQPQAKPGRQQSFRVKGLAYPLGWQGRYTSGPCI